MIRTGVRYALAATLFFAFMQLGVKTLNRLPSHEIVFFRAIFSLGISFAFIKRAGLNPWGNNKKVLFLRGLCGAIALMLFFYTLQQIPLATAVLLQYLSPIFTVLFATFIMKESATWKQWLAFLVALAGVALVKGFDPRISMLSLSIGVLSAAFSGLAYNFIRKLKDTDHPLIVVMYFPLISIPVSLPFMFNGWIWPNWQEWLMIALVGVFTQAAQWCMTKAYQMEKAADILIFKYLGIVYALSFGFIFFDETMGLFSLVGIVVVVLGVYLGTLGKRQARHIKPSAESIVENRKV